jgi:glycosyltransferase involved in cell wall biosynthesis
VYAIEAARLLENSNVEFTFAGNLEVSLPNLPSNCSYIGHIPRTEIGNIYSAHHVFVLPTLSDGFALTQVEALAHGLPVVATRNCGDVVEHGISGLLIPPRDSKALAEAVLQIGSDRAILELMSENALQRAKAFTAKNIWPSLRAALNLCENC